MLVLFSPPARALETNLEEEWRLMREVISSVAQSGLVSLLGP